MDFGSRSEKDLAKVMPSFIGRARNMRSLVGAARRAVSGQFSGQLSFFSLQFRHASDAAK